MPQIVRGIYLGSGVYLFVESGTPAESTDKNVINAGLGSVFLSTSGVAGSTFFVLTAAGWSAVA